MLKSVLSQKSHFYPPCSVIRLFQAIAKELSQKIGSDGFLSFRCQQKSIRSDFAYVLLQLGTSFGEKAGETNEFDLILSREENSRNGWYATESVIRLLSDSKRMVFDDLQVKKSLLRIEEELSRLSDFYA